MFFAADFNLSSGVLVVHYLLPGFYLDGFLIIPHFNDYTDLGFFLCSIRNDNSPADLVSLFSSFTITLSAKGLTFMFASVVIFSWHFIK